MSDQVLDKLGSIDSKVTVLSARVERLDGKVDVLQGMFRPGSEEVTNSGETKRNAAIGKLVVKLVGGGGFVTALATWGGTQFHEYQREQAQIETEQRSRDLSDLKRQIIAEQKRAIDESTAKQTEELEAGRDSSDSAGSGNTRIPRDRTQRSNR